MTTLGRRLLLVILLCVPVNGWAQNDAKKLWKDVVKKCAASDLLGNKVLYLGPSNAVGPGTILRQKSQQEGGGYAMRWTATNVEPTDQERMKFIQSGKETKCQGVAKKQTSLSLEVIFKSAVAPITGNLGVDYKRARSVTVSVQYYAWDDLIEGPYVRRIDSPGFDATIRADLRKPERFILVKALRVKGLATDLVFDADTAVKLNPHYNGPTGVGPAEISGDFKGQWTSKTTLHLESASPDSVFYLAGELSAYSELGFAGSGRLKKVTGNYPEKLVEKDKDNQP